MFPPFRGFVRIFVIACTCVFVLQQFALYGPFGDGLLYQALIRFLGLEPALVVKGMVFQLVTWIFLHGNLMHILFNMFAFWMFGSLLEEVLGFKRFAWFTIISGAVTGIIVILWSLVADPAMFSIPTIGASGVVFAILIAVSRMFPNQMVLFFFIFPMKLRYFSYLLIAIEFYALYSSNEKGISNIAHLGGALVGWFYVTWLRRSGGNFSGSDWIKQMRDQWANRRRRRHLRIVHPDDQKWN